MKFKIVIFFIVICLFFSFSAAAQYLEVALVSDIGGFKDNSYNDQLRSSISKVGQNLNILFEFRESTLMTEYLENINYFAENNFDLIWGVGFAMEQAVKEAAQMYPEKDFVIFDGVVEEENVSSITFKKSEAAFLAGIIAALESQNSKIAFIGAKENQELKQYQIGFNTGAQIADSEVEVYNRYLGSFNNFSKAKKIAEELVAKNVDIIFYAAGAASNGIIENALEKNIYLISLNRADINLAPNNILTVILKNTDQIAKKIIEAHYNDNYVNEIKEYGISDNAFILAPKQAEKLISSDTLIKIEEYKQQFLAGEIQISEVFNNSN
jgi:basic membrane protein A